MPKIDYIDLLGKEFEYGGRGPSSFDCWGVCIEMSNRAGIDLPEFPHPSEFKLIDGVMSEGTKQFTKLDKPEPNCIVTFMLKPPYITHAGIVLEDSNKFIHIMERSSVTVERMDIDLWKDKVRGFYRYDPR